MTTYKAKKLNLGCGNDIKKGWINLDSTDINGVDIVHNIENLPLPFENNYFDFILCQDIFEHIDYIPVLKDLYRILKTKGTIKIRVPHFTSKNNFVDPTHKKIFSIKTFYFFTESSVHGRNYYFDFHFSKASFSKITFEKNYYLFYNHLIEIVINSNRFLKEFFYESTFLSRLFPAQNIEIILKK